jgi:hypothetical protein
MASTFPHGPGKHLAAAHNTPASTRKLLMRTFHKMLLTIAVFLSTLTLATPADAQILQNILDRATQARDRALQARDRATEARNHAQDVRATIQEAVQTLTGQIRDVITDSLEEANRIVNEELDGYSAFVNGGCPSFRQDLVTMLQQFEGLLNALAAIADPQAPSISFEDEVGIVNFIPCQVLFPLYRAMAAVDSLDSQLLNRMSDTTASLWLLQPIVAGQYSDVGGALSGSSLDYELAQTVNQLIINNPTAVNNATLTVNGLGITVKTIGKRLQSKGNTGLAAIKLQIHGYAGVALQSDQKMKWGTILVGISEILSKVGNTAGTKISHAMLIGSLAELRDNQEAILFNQALILARLEEVGIGRR